jgi:hypothetical protein
MSTLWQVLGRGYLEEPFYEALKGKTEPGQEDASQLSALQTVLEDHGHITTLWERGEINRIFSLFQDTKGKAAGERGKLYKAWADLCIQPLPGRPTNLWAVLGLASIDSSYRTRLTTAATSSSPSNDLAAELAKTPAFPLTFGEGNALVQLLSQSAARDALVALGDSIWVVKKDSALADLTKLADAAEALVEALEKGRTLAKVPCSGGHRAVAATSQMTAPFHLDAPLLDLLTTQVFTSVVR